MQKIYIENIKYSKSYFAESYGQWSRYIYKWRGLETIGGAIGCVLAIFFGIVAYWLKLFNATLLLTNILLLLVGLFLLYHHAIRNYLSVNRMTKSKMVNDIVEFSFSEAGISAKSKYIQSSVSWDGVERINEAPKGVYVCPSEGVHFYFPKKDVSPETVEYILSKNT